MFTFQKISSKFAGKKMNTTFFYKQTLFISILNIIFFFLLLSISHIDSNLPLYFSAWKFETGLFAPYQLISYQFIHANLSHLLLNLIVFVPTALYLEKHIRTRLLYYFLISGVFGGVLHLILYQNTLPLVGASGSIWGLSVLLAMISKSTFLKVFTLVFFISEVYKAFDSQADGIAHWCHIGGALGGLLIYYFEININSKN